MAGLFEKDIRLILQSKQIIVAFVAMAFFLSFSENLDMVIPYITVFGTIFAITTINYDEVDNGYMYLMTLPASSKDYVYEKYIFCAVGGLVSGLFGFVLFLIGMMTGGSISNIKEVLVALSAGILISVWLESLFIPVQLKYGDTKSRVFFAVMIGALVGIEYFASRFLGDIKQNFANIAKVFQNTPPVLIIIAVLAVTIIILIVSVFCSVGIMRRRQY